MNKHFPPIGVLVAALSSSSYAADPPDLYSVRSAIVIVVATGVVPSLGNAPVATQGTGFFVSKDGYLVTAYHLRRDLGEVSETSVSYEVHFGPTAAEVVRAAPIYTNPVADIMVLYASVGDRDVRVLKPADRSGILPGSTAVYTVGFPQGYQYTVDQGIIKSFGGVVEPIPVWATNLTFKSGQSGSPIILADYRVIAVAKGDDKDATSIGLVVPIRLVPAEYWDGSLVLSPGAADALQGGDTGSLNRVRVQAVVAARPTERQAVFEVHNEHCEGSSTKTYSVAATEGWQISTASVKVETLGVVGAGAQWVFSTKDPGRFTIAVQLNNIGRCMSVFGSSIASDLPARFTARLTYEEVPSRDTRQVTTFSDAAAIGNVRTPLPNLPLGDLRFSVVHASGAVQSFQPQAQELTTKAGLAVLDTAKVIDRLSALPRLPPGEEDRRRPPI